MHGHVEHACACCLQAKIPKELKDQLKPWQLEGLLHMFDTIILDHEADLRIKNLQDQRAAAKVLSNLTSLAAFLACVA